MREKIIKQIHEKKLVAIVRGIDQKDVPDVANALYAGGINLIEVTFVQNSEQSYSGTTNAIKAIVDSMADKMTVGAGTVLTEKQVELAKIAGASYIVTPNTNEKVIRYARKLGMVTMPGAFTATEVVNAYEAGADFVKVFPAGVLGPSYIKALRGPLRHIPFIVVGGVNEHNITEFLKAGACGAGIGGNLIRKDLVQAGKFNEITEMSKQYVMRVKGG